MTSFALVAEGITDQVVLERIIETVIEAKGEDDVEIVHLQPIRDATDESRQGAYGGWERVFEFCSSPERLREALIFNNYLVIHVDTDCCEHPNFGVSRTNGGVMRAQADLIADVRQALAGRLGQEFCNELGARLIFAIAVHNIEFWILPFYGDIRLSTGSISCEKKLKETLAKRRLTYKKDYQSFTALADCFSNYKEIERCKDKNYSLSVFIDSLLAI